MAKECVTDKRMLSMSCDWIYEASHARRQHSPIGHLLTVFGINPLLYLIPSSLCNRAEKPRSEPPHAARSLVFDTWVLNIGLLRANCCTLPPRRTSVPLNIFHYPNLVTETGLQGLVQFEPRVSEQPGSPKVDHLIMDPLSALSISTAVVQFLDFGNKVLSKSTEIYNSTQGASLENQHVEAVAANMLDLSRQLEEQESKLSWQISGPISESEARSRRHRSSQWKKELDIREKRQEELLSIVTACKKSAIELLNVVERLKVQGPNTKWKVFRQALCTVWRTEQVDAMMVRLERYRDQLNTLLLTSIR